MKISKKAIQSLRKKLTSPTMLKTKEGNNRSKYYYDSSGFEKVKLSHTRYKGGTLSKTQRNEKTINNSVSRTYKNSKQESIDITHIHNWTTNPLQHPIKNKKIKEQNVSFLDLNTEYGKLYYESFRFLIDHLQIDLLEHDRNTNIKNINDIKSKLPKLHCYHVNNNIEQSFDFLFYHSYIKILKSNKIDTIDLHHSLKYVGVYETILNNFDILLKKNIQLSPLTHENIVSNFINIFINEFIYQFVKKNMKEIENIVLYKNLLSNAVSNTIKNNLQTLNDIKQIESDFLIDYSSAISRIRETIFDSISEMCQNTNIDHRQYKKIIKKLDIGKFLTLTSRDLIEISKSNQSLKTGKYEMLIPNEIELEEPMKPFLKQPPPLPEYPKKEDIEKNFVKPGQNLTAIDRKEMDEIFELKKQRYNDAKRNIDNFENDKKEYEIKLKDYETKKSIYLENLETIKKRSKSPLKHGSKEKTPPNKGKSNIEILGELIGDDVDKCNLDDDGALSTPFTTDFTPLKTYPLSKLQLVVKIHSRNKDNKIIRTDCGNPIDLYNYLISFYNEGKDPIHPLTKKLLTKENIDAIMEKLPFAIHNPFIERPVPIKNFDDKLFISFVNNKGYYTAYIMRNFGGDDEDESIYGIDIPIYQICSFPSDIGSDDSIDRTSTGMAYMLDMLFSERRLLHNYNSPYGIMINNDWSVLVIRSRLIQYKSKKDWIINNETKQTRNRKDIEDLFFSLYDEIARI
jgi:hypothetical protein